jgi:hypothetical protein
MDIKKLDDGRHLFNGIELQYIPGSVLPFFKLKHKDPKIQEDNLNDFMGMFDYMKTHLKGYFTIGTLYNAYQEKSDGELLKNYNGLGHDVILADSGGLQQARRGEKFSDEVKREIFLHQAKFSDYAMNFDEMPFKSIEANFQTGVNLMSTRCYIREMIDSTAKASAEEIRKQLEAFDSVETNCKVIPVLHGFRANPGYYRGRTDNTYLDYARTILENIDNDNKHMGGLSFGGITVAADNRIGLLKSLNFIPDTLWAKDIPDKNLEHIHILGMASPQKLMIFLSLVRAGLIDPRVKRLSFDSTAITKAYTVGRVHKNRYEFDVDSGHHRPELTLKYYNDPTAKNVRQYYQNVHNYFKGYDGYMFKSWEDLADHSPNNGDKRKLQEQIEAKGGVGGDFNLKFLQQVRLCTMYAAWVYLEAMEDYLDGKRTAADFPYGSDVVAIYHSIEHDIKDTETLHEAIEMHYAKVKSNMDFGVDTLQQYEDELDRLTTEATHGKQETNVLFEDVEKLHSAHADQKAFAQQKIDNNNFMRRSKKKHCDEHIHAKDITDSLF